MNISQKSKGTRIRPENKNEKNFIDFIRKKYFLSSENFAPS